MPILQHKACLVYVCAFLCFVLFEFDVCLEVANSQECRTYPDFGFIPDTTMNRRLFRLSQNFPKNPPVSDDTPAFFRKDLALGQWREFYKKNWRDYMLAVRDYCFEGNIEVDWVVQENHVRKWYHMPWQHWGRLGREGLRGLTKEAAIKPKQLAPTQKEGGQTYAIAFYNSAAAYLLNEIWKDPDAVDVEALVRLHGFPNGSVVSKLLFADIPLEQVPFLANPISWEAYITKSYGSDDRTLRLVHLIQMDVMIKDDRAENGWVFGTYQYNGQLKRENPWENLIPVGLQWGNDPEVTGNEFTNPMPTSTRINPAIKESVINPDTAELPPTHLGWNGRLNGPVDNPRSACFSCHMAAQYPYAPDRIAPMFVKGETIPEGSNEWMRWFDNLDCMTPFDSGTVSTDSSLQLAISLHNYFQWKNQRGGVWVDELPPLCPPERK